MRDWLVAADDRTGAFEVAALFAATAGPTVVTVGSPAPGSCVVDIGSRALTRGEAIVRAGAMEATPSRWSAHKIDSTLRGHWAAELLARRDASGRRIAVLPAWPEMGRTCIGGVVHVHGEPLGNVVDELPGAVVVADADGLRKWLATDVPMVVCDLADEGDVLAVAAVLAAADVLVAGPAGPLGAVFASRSGAWPSVAAEIVVSPVMVVCGSANPVAREQLARLAASSSKAVIVASGSVEGELDAGVAVELAQRAHDVAAEVRPATVVLIGGETAAAFLGDDPRVVSGSIAAGMPVSRDADGVGPLVITKAGGFGAPDALVRLLQSP